MKNTEKEPSTLVEHTAALRRRVNTLTLDGLENFLNRTKGTGITPKLMVAAERANVPLVVHSEKWKNDLENGKETKVRIKVYTEIQGGEVCFIDNGIPWVLLKEAQALRRQCEALLNYIEQKRIRE